MAPHKSETVRKRVLERYASLQDPELLSDRPQNLERLARVYGLLYGRHLPRDREARILELGCGGGHFLYFLHRMGYAHLTGVDASPEQVGRCRELELGKIVQGEAKEFLRDDNGKDDAYDLVFARHLIEHVPLDEALDLLGAVRRRLREGGAVLLVTPNALSPWASYHLYHDLTHERLYAPDSLAALLRLAGFAGVQVFPEGPVSFDPRSAVRNALFRLRHWWLATVFAIENGIGREALAKLIFTPAIIGRGIAGLETSVHLGTAD